MKTDRVALNGPMFLLKTNAYLGAELILRAESKPYGILLHTANKNWFAVTPTSIGGMLLYSVKNPETFDPRDEYYPIMGYTSENALIQAFINSATGHFDG